ncbi:MAG: hypothetical protein IJG38_04760 [Thermoguttaceae bacterium]|nr:hypothetical protein [Thermoguttaceae bacterium]MBQ6615410.1 hypothetical protein [Thermoguttaceae bacterium]
MTDRVIPKPPFWEKFLKFFKKVGVAGGKLERSRAKRREMAAIRSGAGGGVKIPTIVKTAKIATRNNRKILHNRKKFPKLPNFSEI